jgi:hypothetical protein
MGDSDLLIFDYDSFESVVIPLLVDTHIFTTTTTFHGTIISNHNVDVFPSMDVVFCFLAYSSVNEVIGDTIVN